MRHCENENWQCKGTANPQAQTHVAQFAIILGRFRCRRFRFESHAADRTTSRMNLFDLRMHRTGVNYFLVFSGGIEFKSHSALLTFTRFVRDNLRVHWAEVLSVRRWL